MSSLNKKKRAYTHEGAPAGQINAYGELRRSALACMLWEDQFYESGESIADRISELVKKVDPKKVSELAIEARTKFRLRHVPLLLARELARSAKGKIIGKTIFEVIQRPDELTEFLSIYWEDGKQPLSAQTKIGLAKAFQKFDEYQLAKYNRDGAVKLRDVLFLCHAKPKNDEQAEIWKRLVGGELKTPDTWEVALSGGDDKKASFERLLKDNKLGYMALLRNLRNMKESGVSEDLVFNALQVGAEKSKALPFRYVAAARAVPAWEREIDQAMIKSLSVFEKIPGKTILMVDHSVSMRDQLSNKSDLSRFDAACALAVLLNGICERVEIFSFAADLEETHGSFYSREKGYKLLEEIPPRQGMALCDAIKNSMEFGGTQLGRAVGEINKLSYDRLIVITDEQSMDPVPNPKGKGYMINVASYENGIDYGAWTHITGFSESVIDYIREYESLQTIEIK